MNQATLSSVPDVARLAKLGAQYRPRLHAPHPKDEFLVDIARQAPSHNFLANSVQAVYGRQVAFLSAILQEYRGLPPEQIKVLDWGCGKGHITYLLQQQGFQVTSCDVASAGEDSTFGQDVPIVAARKISVVPLHHPSKLPFADHSFDCVVSFGVLEHVPSDTASLEEIHRVLEPGGVFFVTFLPYFLSWTQALAHMRGDNYHDRLYRKRTLRPMVENAAFRLAGVWHGQFFPKNSMPFSLDHILEPMDRFLCSYTPFKYFATNVEVLMMAV